MATSPRPHEPEADECLACQDDDDAMAARLGDPYDDATMAARLDDPDYDWNQT